MNVSFHESSNCHAQIGCTKERPTSGPHGDKRHSGPPSHRLRAIDGAHVKAPPDQRALLELLEADSIKEARRAVAALERDGYEWTPLGGKEGNFGLVNIGSDPGFAFVERITNALDAATKRRVTRPLRSSPSWTRRARPLLAVRDRGMGIAPDAMPATILNLAGSNKIAKPYLAGAYGQGGSTTFAFSPDGTVIAAATADSPVGVTFVRFRELDARTNKKWTLRVSRSARRTRRRPADACGYCV
jgi:hypothetical protein